ncbi:MAG: hypothetical protein K2Y37_19270 [Pirellulales bacterium]|nr:hypothetical protein [Pirellulales bacterium]
MSQQSPGSPPPTARVANRPPRRWSRRFAIGGVFLVLLFVAAPYILGSAPVRNLFLRIAVSKIDGRITCGKARLGWFSAPAFHEIAISPPNGPPLLSIARIELDRPLWRLITGWPDCGRVVCEKPVAHLIVDDTGSNFRRVFAPLQKDEPDDLEPHERPWTGVPQVRAEVEIADASVIVERVAGDGSTAALTPKDVAANTGSPIAIVSAAAQQPTAAPPPATALEPGARWEVGGIHVVAGLRPIPNGQGVEAYVAPGKLIDHAELTRAVAAQWLQFIAPVLSGSAKVDGSFSVDLAEWRIPLEHPDEAVCGGHVIIHSLVVESGPMVTYLASLVGVPAELLLARDTGIEFEMENRRVYHRDLGFRLGGLPVHTSGSVGLDRTLDLVAEITLPTFADDTGPLRRALSGKTIEVPVHGTLAKPELDGQALAHSGMGILDDALGGLLDRLTGQSGPAFPDAHTPAAPPSDAQSAPAPADAAAGDEAPAAPAVPTAEGSAPQSDEPATTSSPANAAGEAAAVAMPIVEELLKAWRERRQRGQTSPPTADGTPPAPSSDAAPEGAPATESAPDGSEAAPRRPLRDTWRRFRDRRRRTTEEVPTPAPAQPAPSDASLHRRLDHARRITIDTNPQVSPRCQLLEA